MNKKNKTTTKKTENYFLAIKMHKNIWWNGKGTQWMNEWMKERITLSTKWLIELSKDLTE